MPIRSDDDSLEGTYLKKYGDSFLEGSAKLGVKIDETVKTKQYMEEAGFVDIVERIYKWPVNRWPANKKMKEMGMFIFYFICFSVYATLFEIWSLEFWSLELWALNLGFWFGLTNGCWSSLVLRQ